MRIYLSCSKTFYDRVEDIKTQLENLGHLVTPPNGWNDQHSEGLIQQLDLASYVNWKGEMLRKNIEIVSSHDAVLVLNFDKGEIKSYMGGSSFLEAYEAFRENLRLFLYNPVLDNGPFKDELVGFNPRIINGDLKVIS